MSTIEFFGESFELRGKAPQFAMMKFARAVRREVDGGDLEGMAAMLDLIQKCLRKEDWERFEKAADENDPTEEQLTEIVVAAFHKGTGRPTGQPSDSSDGLTSIGPRSAPNADASTSRFAGRPDLLMIVEGRRSA